MQVNEKMSIKSIILELENEIINPPEEEKIKAIDKEIKCLISQRNALGAFQIIKKAKLLKEINSQTKKIKKFKKDIEINTRRTQRRIIKLKLKNGDLKKYDTLVFGNYHGDVEWLILAVENDKVLLLSKYIIDCMPYHTVLANVAWDKSFIRSWLNNTFLNYAFTCEQQSDICYTNVNPDDSYRPRQQGVIIENRFQGEYTRDKIFLLSAKEAQEYFNSGAERCASKTSYAEQKAPTAKADYWWLRTVWALYHTNNPNPPLSANAWAVCGNLESVDAGKITDGFPMNFDSIGIRPAIWLSLED